jgi:hypothetical protein
MKIKLVTASLLLAAAALPAFAADAPKAGNACLMRNQIDGWGARDDHSMIVNDRFGKKYLLTLAGLCSDINFSMAVGIKSLGPSMAMSCVERGDRIVMRGGGAMPHNDTCWVTNVQLYTADMEKADKAARDAKHNESH